MKLFIILFLTAISFAACADSKLEPTPCDCLEYQIRLEMDGAYIYDGDRFVGALPFDSTQSFDKLMMKDNE